jgi:hypothetical protein
VSGRLLLSNPDKFEDKNAHGLSAVSGRGAPVGGVIWPRRMITLLQNPLPANRVFKSSVSGRNFIAGFARNACKAKVKCSLSLP